MDFIIINGQECPVLKMEDGLPVVTYKGHNGAIASNEEDAAGLMFSGMTFWCPVDLIRPSLGDENIRKDAPTEREIDKARNLIRVRKDIGTVKIVLDSTGAKTFRVLDGNTRFPLFLAECKPSHVFAEYCEVMEDELSIINEQIVANTHNETTEKSRAFYSLRGKLLAKDLPTAEARDEQLAILYADAGGKNMFVKRCKRAQNAIDGLWVAFASNKISIESLDAIATLINPDSGEILAELQRQVLNSAIDNNLKTTQIAAKVTAALANLQAEWEASQQVRVPEPVEVADADEFDIAPSKGAGRPASAKASSPPTPKPAPVEKVTAAAVVQKQQEVKATKGKGGKPKAASAPKVITNAPASIPAAIAANPNVSIAVIGRDIEAKVAPVEIYQPLLDVEEILVKNKLVLSNGSGLTKEAWKGMESLTLKGVSDVLAQCLVIRSFLTKIEESASAVQMDLKDK